MGTSRSRHRSSGRFNCAIEPMLFRRNSRQSQSTKLEQAAQVEEVATIQELAEPWSSKTFIFHRPETKEDISSIVIRLPDGAPGQPGSY